MLVGATGETTGAVGIVMGAFGVLVGIGAWLKARSEADGKKAEASAKKAIQRRGTIAELIAWNRSLSDRQDKLEAEVRTLATENVHLTGANLVLQKELAAERERSADTAARLMALNEKVGKLEDELKIAQDTAATLARLCDGQQEEIDRQAQRIQSLEAEVNTLLAGAGQPKKYPDPPAAEANDETED